MKDLPLSNTERHNFLHLVNQRVAWPQGFNVPFSTPVRKVQTDVIEVIWDTGAKQSFADKKYAAANMGIFTCATAGMAMLTLWLDTGIKPCASYGIAEIRYRIDMVMG